MCKVLSAQPLLAQADDLIVATLPLCAPSRYRSLHRVFWVQDATLAQAVKGSPVAQPRLPFPVERPGFLGELVLRAIEPHRLNSHTGETDPRPEWPGEQPALPQPRSHFPDLGYYV